MSYTVREQHHRASEKSSQKAELVHNGECPPFAKSARDGQPALVIPSFQPFVIPFPKVLSFRPKGGTCFPAASFSNFGVILGGAVFQAE
jgi:hypothetical protein